MIEQTKEDVHARLAGHEFKRLKIVLKKNVGKSDRVSIRGRS